MFKDVPQFKTLLLFLLLTFTAQHANGMCDYEKRPENLAACEGQIPGMIVPYPGDCTKFLVCIQVCKYPVVKECPNGLWWDDTFKFCNLPILVNCNASNGTTTAINSSTTETETTPISIITTESGDSTQTTQGTCNNEIRAENQAACKGQVFGALVSYPGDCTKFLSCIHFCEYPVVHECPSGLWWDNKDNFCNFPLLVDCDYSNGTTPTEGITTPTSIITTESEDSTKTTPGRCNNERRPENQAACAGQVVGALVPYPGDCSKFLVCIHFCEYPVVRECPNGLYWDNRLKVCNIPLLVDCDNSNGTTPTEGITTPTSVITTESGDSTQTTPGRCNNERRPENQAACAGQVVGALVPYPGDCSKFLVCIHFCEYPVVRECPNGLYWDNKFKVCSIPLLVDCDYSNGTTPTAGITTPTSIITTESGDSTQTTPGRCNNERRPENQAACKGQVFGALVPYPGDCSKFLVCIHFCEYPVVRECPNGLYWDNRLKVCNIPLLVDCDNSNGTTTTEGITTPTSVITTESGDSTQTTPGRCNNERRPENQAACKGQVFGALVPYPGDCSKFLACIPFCEYPVVHECPHNLWWDNSLKICNFRFLVECDESSGTTTAVNNTTTTPSSIITTESEEPTDTTRLRCDNERRPENQAACKGQVFGSLVPYPGDCSKFLACIHICEYPPVTQCPGILLWDDIRKICNYPRFVNCDANNGTTTPVNNSTTDGVTTPISIITTESGDSTQTTPGRCNNERRPENQAACKGQVFGAFVPYPGDCSKFLTCIHFCEYPSVHECPHNLWWDNSLKICNFRFLVNCDNNIETTTPLDKTTTEELTTPISTTTTESNNWGKDCLAPEGMSADICLNHNNDYLLKYPYNCNAYLNCTLGCPIMQYCDDDKFFNVIMQICDTPDFDDCEELLIPTTATTTTENFNITTPSSISPSEKCVDQDAGVVFPYQQNCHQFIYCNGNGGFFILNCPYNQYYDTISGACILTDDSEICF